MLSKKGSSIDPKVKEGQSRDRHLFIGNTIDAFRVTYGKCPDMIRKLGVAEKITRKNGTVPNYPKHENLS
jgi:hypothetical protein